MASEPIANNATSQFLKSKVSKSLTFNNSSPKLISVPTDFLLASAAILETGNFLSDNILSISLPTFPVAPTTATEILIFVSFPFYNCRLSSSKISLQTSLVLDGF